MNIFESKERLHLGPIQELMEDDEVTEIMINGPRSIFVERRGRKAPTHHKFESAQQLRYYIERMLNWAPGKRLDDSSPYVDLSLPGGARINAVIPPLVPGGPHVTIRKHVRPMNRLDDFVRWGTMDRRMCLFLYGCIRAGLNVVFSGGTGVGKTTLLEILAQHIDDEERLIVIEDTYELNFRQSNVVRMLTRPSNLEGKGAVTSGDLFSNSLRMTPSRIILGEIRGKECMDFLQAVNSGHDGSLAILHAASPEEAVVRMEHLCTLSGLAVDHTSIRRQISHGIDVVVQLHRHGDGTRRVTRISELLPGADGQVEVQDIFRWKQAPTETPGEVSGRYVATGYVPSFHHQFAENSVALGRSVYGEKSQGEQGRETSRAQ